MTPVVQALEDSRLEARIIRRVPMRYAAGPDPTLDMPAHVRAASGLAAVGDRLAVIQDDAAFIALVDPQTGVADALVLPAGADGVRQFDDARGNKQLKLDLESIVGWSNGNMTTLAAFGSGSLQRREVVVLVELHATALDARWAITVSAIDVFEASTFYSMLQQSADFAGSDMNVEGALLVDGTLRLFSRGNGATRDDRQPLDASCDVRWHALLAHLRDPSLVPAPSPQRITQYELGLLEGVRLSVTDVCACPSGTMFCAAAEESPDARRDGAVRGSVLGVLPTDSHLRGRWTPVLDEQRRPFTGKIEGVYLDPRREGHVFLTVDCDSHAQPSELLEATLAGPWW